MNNENWHYDSAIDGGVPFFERLKRWPREPDPFVYAARFAAAATIRAWLKVYNRFEITGAEHLPREGSFVLVANHASHLDAVALLSALPVWSLHRASPVAALDYFCANRWRLLLSVIVANAMFLERDRNGVCRLDLCRRMLEEKSRVVLMFPEGTRSTDGRVGRFKRGVGLLLAGAAYPVVPCFLDGTFEAWPKGAPIPRPSRVRLIIGAARTYHRVKQDEQGVTYICRDLRNAVVSLAPEPAPQTISTFEEEAYL